MPEVAVVAIAVAAVIIVVMLALYLEGYRRSRRFARKISPYERRRAPGSGQQLDPDDVPHR